MTTIELISVLDELQPSRILIFLAQFAATTETNSGIAMISEITPATNQRAIMLTVS
jgi:hypothetical protein